MAGAALARHWALGLGERQVVGEQEGRQTSWRLGCEGLKDVANPRRTWRCTTANTSVGMAFLSVAVHKKTRPLRPLLDEANAFVLEKSLLTTVVLQQVDLRTFEGRSSNRKQGPSCTFW